MKIGTLPVGAVIACSARVWHHSNRALAVWLCLIIRWQGSVFHDLGFKHDRLAAAGYVCLGSLNVTALFALCFEEKQEYLICHTVQNYILGQYLKKLQVPFAEQN
jgi:hypothetical protein